MTPETQHTYRCRHRQRVRWVEVDLQKIVFNAHYLTYLDTAMAAYWRDLALPYQEALGSLGGDLYVKKASLEYHASARYDEVLEVGMRCAHIGNTSLLFNGSIWRGSKLLISGELVYVFADPATQRPKPVPLTLRSILEGFERGDPMTDTVYGGWSMVQNAVQALRIQVFEDEKGLKGSEVGDHIDATAMHLLIRNQLQQAVSAARLQFEGGDAWISHLAVHSSLRESGLGVQMLEILKLKAREAQATRILLQTSGDLVEYFVRAGGFEVLKTPSGKSNKDQVTLGISL